MLTRLMQRIFLVAATGLLLIAVVPSAQADPLDVWCGVRKESNPQDINAGPSHYGLGVYVTVGGTFIPPQYATGYDINVNCGINQVIDILPIPR
jgi:hypothetical protein